MSGSGSADGGVLERAVHPLRPAVGPGMGGLGQPMVDLGLGAGQREGVRAEPLAVGQNDPQVGRGRALVARRGEVRPVVGEHNVDLVGDRCDQPLQEVGGGLAAYALVQLDEGEPAGAVDGHDHAQLALLGAQFRDVDVEVADRIGLEAILGGILGLDQQAEDIVPLQQAAEVASGSGAGSSPAAHRGSRRAAAACDSGMPPPRPLPPA